MLDKGKGSAHWTKEKETPLLLTLFLSNVIEMFIKSCILIPTENVKVIIIYLFCHILPCDGAIFKLLPEPSFCFACLGPSCSRHDCFCKINLYCCLFVICIILFILLFVRDLHHFIVMQFYVEVQHDMKKLTEIDKNERFHQKKEVKSFHTFSYLLGTFHIFEKKKDMTSKHCFFR